jgi:ribosomal protein S12 methylthiotransferase accessory factor
LRTDDPVAQLDVLQRRLGLREVLCVPFYDPARRDEALVPIRLLEIECASNGMCAGNTPHEALVQGVCELFERHALTRIFLEQPRLPEIPRAYFGDAEIVARIARLEAAEGWRVTVKDCSLGMGVPIVGALIHDPSGGSCAFHIGVAPSPATALERCLTEIFQTGLSSRLLPIDLSDDPLARALASGDSIVIGHHVAQYFRTGAVRFPLSILEAPEGVAFDGAAWEEGADDAEDLAILLRRVEALGRRLLVRDVSFLGFPAYWAYIPGMSESHLLNLDELVGWYKLSNDHILTWNDLAGASLAELRAFAETAHHYVGAPWRGRRNLDALLFGGQAAAGRSRLGEWLPCVFLRLGDRGRALHYLQDGGADPGERPVAERCLSSALALTESGLGTAAVEERLRFHFAELDVQAAMLWLTDPELAFHQLELPVCFECERCPYLSRCGFIGAAHVVAAVKARHEADPPGCDDLVRVFDGLCPEGGTDDD